MLHYKYSDEGAIFIENVKFLISPALYMVFNVLQMSCRPLYKAENIENNGTATLS